jgi:hypothetical protein
MWRQTLFDLLQHLAAAYTDTYRARPARPQQLPSELRIRYKQEEKACTNYVQIILNFLEEVLNGCNPLTGSRSGTLVLLGVEEVPGGSNPSAQVELDDVAQRLSAVQHCMDLQRFRWPFKEDVVKCMRTPMVGA